MSNQPKVKITACTADAEKNIVYNFMVMLERGIPKSPQHIRLSKGKMREYLQNIYNQAHHGVLEFVQFNFRIENCSRALQQQLTRTRTASYCIESLRVVEPRAFAKNGEYVMSKEVAKDLNKRIAYEKSMGNIQDMYCQLIAMGMKPEDARNILPLGIHSTIHMSVNLRNLITFLSARLCVEAQGEIQQLAREILQEQMRQIRIL